ncbi:MAG TPA: sulfatase [Candidatus Binatia bacterium]
MGLPPILDARPAAVRTVVRATRLARARAWCALALVAVVTLSAGCGRRDDTPLQPVYRLTSVLERGIPRGTPERCAVGDEFRLAIGCVPFLTVASTRLPRPEGDELHLTVDVPPDAHRSTMVLEPRVRGTKDWQRVPSQILPPTQKLQLELALPIPKEVVGDALGVQIFGRPLPPNEQTHRTRPLKIGHGAELVVGLGMEETAVRLGASPVEFRLSVETDDGTRELLSDTLDPLRDQQWVDRRVDLADLAAQTVRFRFETRVVPRPGADPATSFGIPLWGAPQVLEPRRRDGRRNVVLISLDTLRGDHLDGTLNGIPLMPELSAIAARDGTVFENAYTTYPSTSASHMSMFTGLYPVVHNVVFATHTLAPEITTLPEVMARNGYATVAVTENGMLAAPAGFLRGFDYYREFKGSTIWDAKGEIEQTFGAGLRWLEEHPDERFFLFLHTYQVHVPYTPPPEFDIFKTWERDGEQVPIDATTPKFVVDRNLYAGEARYTDSVVKQLLERLAALGLLEETIVVITADHGDEFGEHGTIGHAKHAYDEVLHVPMVFIAPGLVPAGKRIATPVSLVDLMPTLLSLVDLPVPPGVQGRSLVPLLRGETFPEPRVLYAEAPAWGRQGKRRTAARLAGFKWIFQENETVPNEIFDLTVDPGEKAPLDDPQLVRIGQRLLWQYRRSAGVAAAQATAPEADPLADPKPEIDQRTVDKLRELGYLD